MMNVREALSVSRTFGFLGPGPVEDHLAHAEGFRAAIIAGIELLDTATPSHLVDLGTGGGVPGLPLMLDFPESTWVFLDSAEKRMAVVQDLLDEMGLADRCRIRTGRAEELARAADLRGWADVVVARGFAGPAVTAECAAPLLRVGGMLVVSEPPVESNRWNADGLASLGLRELIRVEQPFRFFVAVQTEECPDRFPRRVGIPGKRPLF